jgi:hypothetical protein
MHGPAVVVAWEKGVKGREALVVGKLDAAEGRGINNGPVIALALVG